MSCCLIPADLIDDEFEQLVIAYMSEEHIRIYASLTNHLIFEAATNSLEFHYFTKQELVSLRGETSVVLHTGFVNEIQSFFDSRRPASVGYDVRSRGHAARLLLCDMQVVVQYVSLPPETLDFGLLKFSLQGGEMLVYRSMSEPFPIIFNSESDADGAFAVFVFLKQMTNGGSALTFESSICPELDEELEACESALRNSGTTNREAFKRRVRESLGLRDFEGSGDDYCEVDNPVPRSAELVEFSSILFASQARSSMPPKSVAQELNLNTLEVQPIYHSVATTAAVEKFTAASESSESSDSIVEIDITMEDIRPKLEEEQKPKEIPAPEPVQEESQSQSSAASNTKGLEFSREHFFADLEMLQIGVECETLKGKPAYIRFRGGDVLTLTVEAGCRNVNDVVQCVQVSGDRLSVLCAEKTYEYKAHAEQTRKIAAAIENVLQGIELGERFEDAE